ncbi:MAG: thioredoxin [Clostridia bacterium]|nr:thioredoxin [Clostridia bacterium]
MIFAVRAAVLVIAAVFIVVGALNGGLADVLAKAIAICTECIGLG